MSEMLGIHSYWLFVTTGMLLNLVPGQDSMFIIGQSLTGGRRLGMVSALGIATGCLCHIIAAAFGLSAVLATSASAFTAVKLLGALYLMYLGIKLLMKKPNEQGGSSSQASRSISLKRGFLQGVLTNVMNPKVALFFLALMPQFIDPSSQSKTAAFLFLGVTFITTGTIWCLILAIGAARLRAFFLRNPNVRALIASGMLL